MQPKKMVRGGERRIVCESVANLVALEIGGFRIGRGESPEVGVEAACGTRIGDIVLGHGLHRPLDGMATDVPHGG